MVHYFKNNGIFGGIYFPEREISNLGRKEKPLQFLFLNSSQIIKEMIPLIFF